MVGVPLEVDFLSETVSKVLIIAAISGLSASAGIGVAVRPDPYGEANETLIASMSPYPRSRNIAVVTRKYDSIWWGWSPRYLTEATYELPKPVAEARVRNHFERELGSRWQWNEDGCTAFVRDDAVVLVSVDAFEPTVVRMLVDVHGRNQCDDLESIAES
jgi:hypothetical protein